MMTFPDDYLIPGIEPFHVEEAGIIYNADCRDILPRLPKVDLVLTDPPYNVGKASWDNLFPDIKSWLSIAGCMKDGSNILIFPGEAEAPEKIGLLAQVFKYQWVIVWYKPNAMQFGKTGFTKHSLIWWFSVGKPKKNPKCLDVLINNMGEADNKIKGHPSIKPIRLIKRLVAEFDDNGIILDPFLGSGTTAVAAKELGRKFIGIEISEEYCAIAVKRLRQGVLNFG